MTNELEGMIEAIADEVASRLVNGPVEPAGILSRLELHIVQLRDFIHALPAEGGTVLRGMDHQATARHELMREYVVSARETLASKLDSITLEWRANHGRTMSLLHAMQTELEKHNRRLASIEDALDAAGRNAANRHAETLRRLPDAT